MGFAGYFLIVADFCFVGLKIMVLLLDLEEDQEQEVLLHGLLQFTDLDPLKYELLFERFLNPERVSMPDFDIDFCQKQKR